MERREIGGARECARRGWEKGEEEETTGRADSYR